MTAKEKLRQAVDELTELEAENALAFIAGRREREPAPAIEYLGLDEPSIEQQLAEQGKTSPTDLAGLEPLFASEDERREFLALIGRDA
jgi:hypothetical protein